MPRAKKKTKTIKKRAGRKTTSRRKTVDRRREENPFWNKVIEGFKKLLSPAFTK